MPDPWPLIVHQLAAASAPAAPPAKPMPAPPPKKPPSPKAPRAPRMSAAELRAAIHDAMERIRDD